MIPPLSCVDERDGDAGVADVDVRVMVHRLGRVGRASDPVDPGGEGRERVGLDQRPSAPCPSRQGAEFALDLNVGEQG